MNVSETGPTGANEVAVGTRILIVDDDHSMRRLASDLINRLGLTPTTASSGEEAIALYRAAHTEGRPYAAVVMDLALPGGISGLETTLAIRSIDGDAKVIISSGYLESGARGAALQHGFSGFLTKPLSAEQLTSELRQVLSGLD